MATADRDRRYELTAVRGLRQVREGW